MHKIFNTRHFYEYYLYRFALRMLMRYFKLGTKFIAQIEKNQINIP